MSDLKELDDIDEKSKLNTEGDNAKIKFQTSNNGEAKLEMPDSGNVSYQCGLTKEELMRYANDPFWIAMRRIFFVLFWLLWTAMLVGAVAIIIMTPGCAKPEEPEWYETSSVYELRVDEFKDGDGDQKSDLAGVKEKLSYFEEISVSAIVLDGLYDKNSPKIIRPNLGSFLDIAEIAKAQKVLLKIPMSQVDLTTEEKQGEFVDVLDFWLGKGVAGFVFDEIELLPNSLDLKKLSQQWYDSVSRFNPEDFPRVSILSSYKPLDELELCNQTHMVLNYKPLVLGRNYKPQDLLHVLESTARKNRTRLCRSNLVLGNGDIKPLTTRLEQAERDRLLIFSLLADATPFLYFGDEYGKNDENLPDELQRNHGKTPQSMQWKIVEDFKSQKSNNFFQVFTKTAKLRKAECSIRMGETSLQIIGENIVAMSRIKKGDPSIAVVTNFGSLTEQVDITSLNERIPETGQIEIVSSISDKHKQRVLLKKLDVGAQETIVIQFVPK